MSPQLKYEIDICDYRVRKMMTLEEIAEMLSVPLLTVKRLYYRRIDDYITLIHKLERK